VIRPSITSNLTTRELFSRVYEENMPSVFRYLNYRVGNVAVAEDLTSAVFEKALTAFSCVQSRKISGGGLDLVHRPEYPHRLFPEEFKKAVLPARDSAGCAGQYAACRRGT